MKYCWYQDDSFFKLGRKTTVIVTAQQTLEMLKTTLLAGHTQQWRVPIHLINSFVLFYFLIVNTSLFSSYFLLSKTYATFTPLINSSPIIIGHYKLAKILTIQRHKQICITTHQSNEYKTRRACWLCCKLQTQSSY